MQFVAPGRISVFASPDHERMLDGMRAAWRYAQANSPLPKDCYWSATDEEIQALTLEVQRDRCWNKPDPSMPFIVETVFGYPIRQSRLDPLDLGAKLNTPDSSHVA
jgi:hypothetical protein